MNRFLYLLSAILLSIPFALLFVVFSGTNANAASIYDEAYKTTPKLIITDGNTDPCEQDISLDWSTYISTQNGVPQDYVDSWQRALSGDGRWSVSQNNAAGFQKSVKIVWTEDNSMYLRWFDAGSYKTVNTRGNNMYEVNLSIARTGFPPSCNIYMTGNSRPTQTTISTSGNNQDYWNIDNFITFVDPDKMNYPEGYEGQPIQETYDPEGVDGRKHPKILMQAFKEDGDQRKLTAIMENFDTDGSTNPISLKWQLVETDQYFQNGTLIHEQTGTSPSSAYKIFDYNLTKGKYYTLNAIPSNPPPYVKYDGIGVQFQFFYDGYYITSSTTSGVCNVEQDNSGNYLTGSNLTPPYIRCNVNTQASDMPVDPNDALANSPFGKIMNGMPFNQLGLAQVVSAPIAMITKVINGFYVCNPADNFGFHARVQGMQVLNARLPCFGQELRPFFIAPVLGYNGVNLGFTLQTVSYTVLGGLMVYATLVGYMGLFKRTVDPKDDSIDVLKL